ncbi:MAG: carboxypeptidase-like regulatory domain-containing protein, partial [Ignavibacteriaceae bacterium]
MIKRIVLTVIIFSTIIYSQQYTINGKIENRINNQPLVYANIRILHSTNGTAANKEGEYELKLNAGKYLLVASYIGYISDTLSITVIQNLNNVDFSLLPSDIELPPVIVKPGINPAIAIIRKAILK